MEDIAHIASAAGVILTIVQSWMKTMIALRIVAIATNVMFLTWAILIPIYPSLILNCIVLPLNVWRLLQMMELVRKAESASPSDLGMEWLRPFMSLRKVTIGEILFHKGEVADAMYLIASGRFVLSEIGLELTEGMIVGELGLLAPGRRRTLSLSCVDAGEVLALPYERFEELYFQNPSFGLSFLRLTTGRLFQNIERLEQELATIKASSHQVHGCV